jgi:hypothetical protein
MRAVFLSVLAAVVLGGAVLVPVCARRPVHPGPPVLAPGWPGLDADAVRQGAELEEQVRAVVDRNRTKGQVVAAVRRGDVALAEAVARFERINAGAADLGYLRKCYPDASEAELSFRNLALFLWNWLADPSHGPARTAEITAAFRARFPGRDFDPVAVPVLPADRP